MRALERPLGTDDPVGISIEETETQRAIDAVWRIESARLIAGLTHITHDVGLAEDLAQDALVAALAQWPASGVPDNPAAWLMAIGKRRAYDLFRRNAVLERSVVIASLRAEALKSRKRWANWILFGILLLTLLLFGYVLTYLILKNPPRNFESPVPASVLKRQVFPAIVNARPIGPPGSHPSWKSSTWSSMKATPPRRARTGSGPSCARTRSVWAGSWPDSRPTSPKCTVSSL